MWVGQTLSAVGSAISLLALPSVAVLVLHATPFSLGVLEAFGTLAFPALGLVAGVVADRFARRGIMIGSDALRAAALASVPLAAAAHALTFAQLAIVALLTGVGSVFFDVSYQAYLPSLVARAHLSRSNARLEFTRSLAQLSGGGLAGLLISIAGAAAAVAVDAASFAVSIVSLLAIRTKENVRRGTAGRPHFFADLREGLATVLRSPVLRTIAACTATSNFGGAMLSAVLLIFAYRDAHVAPVALGLIFGLANAGFAGAAFAGKLANRFGLGNVLGWSILFNGAGYFLLPLATHVWPAGIFFVSQAMQTVGAPILTEAGITVGRLGSEGDPSAVTFPRLYRRLGGRRWPNAIIHARRAFTV